MLDVFLILVWIVNNAMLVIRATVKMEDLLISMTQSKVVMNALGKRATSLAILRFITLEATLDLRSFMKTLF